MFFFPYFILIFFLSVFPINAQDINKETDVKDTSHNMVFIKAGIFRMGCNKFGSEHGAPEHQVFLDDFLFDKYEVTNKKFEEIFPDHKLRRSRFSHCDDCPVTKVHWYRAAEYCYLRGKLLPTEAQWEKASGAKSGCEFSWGPDFNSLDKLARGGLKLKDSASPVGSFQPNKFGIYDTAGNVWEWVSDWYHFYYIKGEIISNPRGPKNGRMKVRRGGSWSDTTISMRSGYRDWSYPFSRSFNDIGFRCALNLNNSSKAPGLKKSDPKNVKYNF